MNNWTFFGAFVIGILLMLVTCATPLEYNWPTNLNESQMKLLKEKVGNGKKLYKKNCSTCHGIFGKANDSASDFSKVKMDNYTNSYLKGDYKNHAFSQKLTNEQLTDITLFIYVLKKDSVKK